MSAGDAPPVPPPAPAAPRPLDDATLLARVAGTPLVVLLDVDGTLAPIAPRPADARVPDATRAALRRLLGAPGVHVALVSGRGAADARRLVGLGGAWAVGNHGAEVAAPDGEPEVHPGVAAHAAAMAAARDEVAAAVADVRGVLVEDKRWSLSVHTRLADPAAVPAVRAAVEGAARAHGLRLGAGKEVIELRAPVAVHKGTAVWELAGRLGATAAGASLLFAGDDVTDEDAFRMLRDRAPHALTVRVGAREVPTSAEFVVPDPDAVRAVVERLAELRG